MKEKKTGATRSVRLWPKNEDRLEWAQEAGLNASQMINEVLDLYLKGHIEKTATSKAETIRKALTSPVP